MYYTCIIMNWNNYILVLSLYTGIVFSYVLVQTCVWTVLDVMFFFWAIVAPFSYRQFKLSGKIRIAHIISVLLGLLVPLPSGLLFLVVGHTQSFSLVLFCTPVDENNYIYYTLTLPISIFAGISTFIQIYTTWALFKVAVLCGSYMARARDR